MSDEINNLGQTILDQLKQEYGDLLQQLSETEAVIVQKAVGQISLAAQNAIIDPANAAKYRTDASFAYGTLLNVTASVQERVQHAVRSTVSSVLQKITQILIGALVVA